MNQAQQRINQQRLKFINLFTLAGATQVDSTIKEPHPDQYLLQYLGLAHMTTVKFSHQQAGLRVVARAFPNYVLNYQGASYYSYTNTYTSYSSIISAGSNEVSLIITANALQEAEDEATLKVLKSYGMRMGVEAPQFSSKVTFEAFSEKYDQFKVYSSTRNHDHLGHLVSAYAIDSHIIVMVGGSRKPTHNFRNRLDLYL